MMSESVTRADFVAGLRALGLGGGDTVMLHCSLSSLGRVEGGADGLIDAVLEAVSPDGTVMMPVLPDLYQPFDVHTSPSTVGLVSEVFWRRPEALRSLHPSHSVAAIGARARWLTEGHEDCDPHGIGSPYDRLRSLNGWIVLLGVDHDRNTMLHLAEALAEVPYLRSADLQVVRDGQVRTVAVRNMAYGHRQFIGLDRRLTEAGLQSLGQIGQATVRLMRSAPLMAYCVNLLREDPGALLCSKPSCIFCRWARARIAEHRDGIADHTDWRAVTEREGCGDPHCECCVV
jgi:aminoglycoside 3-N-acetyltransferase